MLIHDSIMRGVSWVVYCLYLWWIYEFCHQWPLITSSCYCHLLLEVSLVMYSYIFCRRRMHVLIKVWFTCGNPHNIEHIMLSGEQYCWIIHKWHFLFSSRSPLQLLPDWFLDRCRGYWISDTGKIIWRTRWRSFNNKRAWEGIILYSSSHSPISFLLHPSLSPPPLPPFTNCTSLGFISLIPPLWTSQEQCYYFKFQNL